MEYIQHFLFINVTFIINLIEFHTHHLQVDDTIIYSYCPRKEKFCVAIAIGN